MKKMFLVLALLATAYTASSQAFLGRYGSCGTCIGRVYEAPACSTCAVNVCPTCW